MPWNCLCSAKEKRKLEISAPILNTEDSQNLQLVPLKQSKLQNHQKPPPPLVIPAGRYNFDQKSKQQKQKKNQKLVSSGHHSEIKSSDGGLANGQDAIVNINSERSSTLKLKRNKKQSKFTVSEIIPLIVTTTTSSALSEAYVHHQNQPGTLGRNKNQQPEKGGENGKFKKQLSNVKFSSSVENVDQEEETEDDDDGGLNELHDDNRKVHGSCNASTNNNNSSIIPSYSNNATTLQTDNNGKDSKEKINENVNKLDVEQKLQKTSDGEGNYDELPLIRLEKIVEGPVANGGGNGDGMIIPAKPVSIKSYNSRSVTPNLIAPLCKSEESIPFIDDIDNNNRSSPRKQTTPESDHDVRFITLHPKNVGSLHTNSKQTKDDQTERYLQLVSQRNPGVIPVSGSRYDDEKNSSSSVPQPPFEHDFQLWQNSKGKGKLCQVCHEPLLTKPESVLRCQSCCLVCHDWCVPYLPSIRYHDTSLIIFRKWLKAHEKLAFPSVYRYIYDESPASTTTSRGEHNLTDSECPYISERSTKENHHHNDEQQRRKSRRRTRSLERRKRPDNLDLESINQTDIESVKDDQNNNALLQKEKKIKLQIVEDSNTNSIKSNVSSTQPPQTQSQLESMEQQPSEKLESEEESKVSSNNSIVVDIHRPNSEVLVIKEQDDYTKDEKIYKQEVPEALELQMKKKKTKNEVDKENEEENKSNPANNETNISKQQDPLKRSSRASDTSDKDSIASEAVSMASSNIMDTVKRKAYSRGSSCNSRISTSSTDDLDEDVVDYAKVDLRKTASSPVSPNHEKKLMPKSQQNNDHSTGQHTIPKSQSFPVPSKQQHLSDALRLHYVTQRILASVLPRRDPTDPAANRPHSEGHDGLQDKYEKEMITMLEQKHGKNYRVFDLQSCISIITLERLCELCKHIDSWLGSGKEKVVVLQDRDDRQRLGAAIAAYLEYLDICASSYTTRNGISNEDLRAQNTIARNWLDLDIFSMKKFLEDFIGPLRVPSHKRYLFYFSGLLSGKIKMNSSPLHLRHISLESPPSWLQYERLSSSSQNTEWNSFIKIYEGLKCVYTSDIHIVPITTRQFLYQIGNLRLRGDIMIRCYQIIERETSFENETRELLFSVQFHTCAITSNDVTFKRDDLDYACDDPRFPNDHKFSLKFTTGGLNENGYAFQSPMTRTEPPGELEKYDSIENLDPNSSCHTQGPLDGSLYATILKSPKSPQNRSNSHLRTPPPPPQRESLIQNVISPPPQFSNRQYEIIDRRSIQSSTPIRNSIESTSREVSESRQTPSIGSKSDYSYVQSRPGTSQSSYRDNKYVTNTSNHYPSGGGGQQVTIVETFTTTNGGGANQNYQNGGRESMRSPLTLSMDSGISSSGVLNRRQQGSSVSPSSFPSQASPQEDRHRELDDILSDMLMTVQDIPDFGKGGRQNTQKIVRSQSVIPTSSSTYSLPATTINHQQHPYGREPVKRSQSYVAQNNNSVVQTTNTYLISNKDRGGGDFYDTSSTTTTLTPPPSESGRETPINNGVYGHHHHHISAPTSNTGSVSNISTLQNRPTITYREKRDVYITQSQQNLQQHQPQQQQQQQPQQHQRDNIMIMDLQHQSLPYPQRVKTEKVVVSTASEDEESIPYHAREHSQPFTYGNVPTTNGQQQEHEIGPDGRMIKMQSGLSSPSLVRKTLGGSQQTLRKTTSPRNDFEEMLRERREKVMSEKYSISDKSASIDFDKSFDRSYSQDNNKWVNNSGSSNKINGYHYYHEPLKRSNTLDGGFGRSNSTDGISGQTWLQLQQQKLRAKKEQQIRDDRRYFDETIHTEIRNRPFRSKANVSRYDGYASDTAAFADEVDYRRPLHVQTPYNANRASDRNYHTLTTTTTTVTQKERPFVTVKRAHEQAQHNKVGSPPMSPLSVLNASPNGHIAQVQAQNQNGLLSMADSSRNGHARLESDNMTNFHADYGSSVACTKNVNINSHNINTNHHTYPMKSNTTAGDDSGGGRRGVVTINDNIIIHETNNDHHHHQPTNVNNNNYNKNSNQNLDPNASMSSIAACGQLALDKLLASLALETDIMEQELAQNLSNNTNNGNNTQKVDVTIPRHKNYDLKSTEAHGDKNNYSQPHNINNNKNNNNNSRVILNGTRKVVAGGKANPELSDVLADLTEYNRHEAMRTLNSNNNNINNNGFSDSSSSNSNGHSNSISTTNGQIRQLVSESDNSSSISPSLSERSNAILWHDQVREESFSSYRSETDPELSIAGSPRPETPAFPVTPRTPYGLSTNGNVSPALPPKSPTSQRKDLYQSQRGNIHEVTNQNDILTGYTTRRNSNSSNANSEPQEVAPHLVKFVRDSSKYWYKPTISREEAVTLLRNASPGTFIVRDSTTFKNAFGLVLRVAHPPPGVAMGPNGDELVRHFLVEPTSRGVRLKGCANEPVFTSLSALVYQHSITPLALPCRLDIPDRDIQSVEMHSPAQKQLIAQGAACNVLYLFTCETESLTGEEAVRKAVSQLYASKPLPTPTEVHFKVSHQGITLTDVTRQKFFRKHYSANIMSFCGLDPEKRLWSIRSLEGEIPVNNKTIFAFVARRSNISTDNQCHVFCDLSPNQPASAIISFANKVLPTEKLVNHHI